MPGFRRYFAIRKYGLSCSSGMITAIDELLARMMFSPKGKAPTTPYFTPTRVQKKRKPLTIWQKPGWGRQFFTDTSFPISE